MTRVVVLALWVLALHGVPVRVANGAMIVTPARDWNRSPWRAIAKSETWSLDGPELNRLYFVGDLAPGQALMYDADRKNQPLPRLSARAQLTDLPDFVESSIRVAHDTSVYQTTRVGPARFLGQDGVRFTFDYALNDDPLHYRGLGEATIVHGHLYAIVFEAPALNFFDRDAGQARAIMDSAKL